MNSPQKLLVLYTGGTIGMQMSEAGLAPASGFEARLRAEQLDLGGPARAGTAWVDRRVDPLPLHRDWVGAREAAIRAGGTLLFFGLLWAWTGWSLIAFGMLGLSVMLLVFSAFENPNRTMAFVLRGQLIGAALALLCQWLVWPWAQSGWQMVWMLLPFALLGGLVFAHKRTAAGAMDTNMAMLILLALGARLGQQRAQLRAHGGDARAARVSKILRGLAAHQGQQQVCLGGAQAVGLAGERHGGFGPQAALQHRPSHARCALVYAQGGQVAHGQCHQQQPAGQFHAAAATRQRLLEQCAQCRIGRAGQHRRADGAGRQDLL